MNNNDFYFYFYLLTTSGCDYTCNYTDDVLRGWQKTGRLITWPISVIRKKTVNMFLKKR